MFATGLLWFNVNIYKLPQDIVVLCRAKGSDTYVIKQGDFQVIKAIEVDQDQGIMLNYNQ